MLGDKDALGQRIAALEAELVCAYSELACSQSEGTVGVHSLAAPVPVFAMGADGLCVAVNPAGSRMRTEICPGSHSFLFSLFLLWGGGKRLRQLGWGEELTLDR